MTRITVRHELETQAAQLFSVGFNGKALGADLEKLVARGVSGVRSVRDGMRLK